MKHNQKYAGPYFLLQYNDRYLLTDSEGDQPFDTCISLEQLISRCKNFEIPSDLISLSPPNKDELANIVKIYSGLELKPLKLSPCLIELIKGL